MGSAFGAAENLGIKGESEHGPTPKRAVTEIRNAHAGKVS
jgi:hypothetical protein